MQELKQNERELNGWCWRSAAQHRVFYRLYSDQSRLRLGALIASSSLVRDVRRHQDQSPHLAERHQSVWRADDLWMREIDQKEEEIDGEMIES